MLLDRGVEYVRADPAKSLAMAAGSAAGAYILKKLISPASYPNIAGPPSSSFLYGHLLDIYSPAGMPFHDSLQDTYGSVAKVNGLMGRESLYISDPRALHEILVKEHENAFRHPQFFYNVNDVLFGPGLLTAHGDAHRVQRKMLTPVFTAKHMKALVPKFGHIAQDMTEAIIKDLAGAESKEIDILHWCSATALELIGQAGLGHTFGVFQGVESEYSTAVKKLLPALFDLMPFRTLFHIIYPLQPASLRRKIVEWTPSANVQHMKHVIDIQEEQAIRIMEDKKAKLKNGEESDMNDILSVLLKANLQAEESNRLPESQIRGQVNTLVFAGHETTSGALTRTLELLALHPNVQDRLRSELIAAADELDYEGLQSLPYLDAVCREVLRLYPPATQIEREALKDWVVPLRYPVKGNDGQEAREIRVRKGTIIYVGLRQANRSRETWGEDADEFKPERWLQELPLSVSAAKTSGVYSSMMTFSSGPRSCIGFKFALLELKTLLYTLVRAFKFAPGKARVEWHLGPTMTPFKSGTTDGLAAAEKHPCMPLVVSLVASA